MRARWSAAQHLLLGQILFFSFLAVCCFLLFNGKVLDYGISTFGTHPVTLVPYYLAFACAGWSIHRACQALKQPPGLKWLRRALYLMAIAMVGVAAIPYSLSAAMMALHDACSVIVFVVELAIGLWLTLKVMRGTWQTGLFVLQAASAMAAALSLIFLQIVYHPLPIVKHDMFFAQLAFQAAFAVLLTRAVSHLSFDLAERRAAQKPARKPFPVVHGLHGLPTSGAAKSPAGSSGSELSEAD
jgi:hypothetical protein